MCNYLLVWNILSIKKTINWGHEGRIGIIVLKHMTNFVAVWNCLMKLGVCLSTCLFIDFIWNGLLYKNCSMWHTTNISWSCYQFFFYSSQYDEYSVIYKEKLFLTAQFGFCGTVSYFTLDCMCSKWITVWNMNIAKSMVETFFWGGGVFMKQVITVHVVYLLIFCRFSWGF